MTMLRRSVTVGLTNDTAPDGPGSDPYRSDLLTNDPRVSGTATDDHGITLLQVADSMTVPSWTSRPRW